MCYCLHIKIICDFESIVFKGVYPISHTKTPNDTPLRHLVELLVQWGGRWTHCSPRPDVCNGKSYNSIRGYLDDNCVKHFCSVFLSQQPLYCYYVVLATVVMIVAYHSNCCLEMDYFNIGCFIGSWTFLSL